MQVQRKHVDLYHAACILRRHGYKYLWTKPERFQERIGYYPLAPFVKDPPILINNIADWDLCSQGVVYKQINGIYHAWTVVGREYSWNAADVLEEWLNGWPSTLAPGNNNALRMLTPGQSKLFIVHGGGWIEEYADYRRQFIDVGRGECMLGEDDPERKRHLNGEDMCACLHWQHVVGEKDTINRVKAKDRRIERTVGDCTYPAVMPIDGKEPSEHHAIIAWRPIDEIHVVDKGIDDAAIEDAIQWLTSAVSTQMPIFITDN